MRFLLSVCVVFLSAAVFGQGTTPAEYYQYQRDQQFKKYMETTGSASLSAPIKTSDYKMDNKAVNEFVDLMQRRNSGNKVVETEEQKKAIRAEMEMERISAEIKASNKKEDDRLLKEGWAQVRTLNFRDGKKFEGHFVNTGGDAIFTELLYGKLSYPEGGYYKGYFAKNYGMSVKHGKGIQMDSDGTVYTGKWSSGRLQGFGIMTKTNGDVYEGNFESDRPDGFGKMTYADGRVEEGFWNFGKFEGMEPPLHSSVPLKSAGKKEVNGRKLSGAGRLKFPDKSVYEGEFKNYNMHGKGTLTYENGVTYTGDFFWDHYHGKGTMKWAGGEMYEGGYYLGERSGKGMYRWVDGSVYEGDFVKGNRTGKGVYRWPDGSRYEGDFVDNQMHGKGIKYEANGKVLEGKWNKGEYIRENVSFSNWKQATEDNQWSALEAPETDENVHRYLDGGKLKFKSKNKYYTWAWTDLGKAQPEYYQYEAVYETKKEGQEGEGGIFIHIDEKNAPTYSKLIFMIKPGKQFFYLGLYDHGKSSWYNFTGNAASQGWEQSSLVNGFNEKGVSVNKLRIQRTGGEISLYINGKLLFTQNIQSAGKPLDKFRGIGIIQGNFLEGSISEIRFGR